MSRDTIRREKPRIKSSPSNGHKIAQPKHDSKLDLMPGRIPQPPVLYIAYTDTVKANDSKAPRVELP